LVELLQTTKETLEMKKFYFTPLAAAVMLASNAIMASEVEKYIGLYVSDISYEEQV
jgi:hypothetical protein